MFGIAHICDLLHLFARRLQKTKVFIAVIGIARNTQKGQILANLNVLTQHVLPFDHDIQCLVQILIGLLMIGVVSVRRVLFAIVLVIRFGEGDRSSSTFVVADHLAHFGVERVAMLVAIKRDHHFWILLLVVEFHVPWRMQLIRVFLFLVVVCVLMVVVFHVDFNRRQIRLFEAFILFEFELNHMVIAQLFAIHHTAIAVHLAEHKALSAEHAVPALVNFAIFTADTKRKQRRLHIEDSFFVVALHCRSVKWLE
mmetsp:Transcript_30070/g.48044  ORF Transcript_30070/g.48044 Transcript_30070/m.48044 type:complete len:254 (+) Transcript_30070:360-1121(+)